MNNHSPHASKMVPTPRTDARVRMMIDNDHSPDGLEYWARDLERELAAAHDRVKELEEWIRGLERRTIMNNTKRRSWQGGNIGWLYPGQCAYIGPKKPKGLR